MSPPYFWWTASSASTIVIDMPFRLWAITSTATTIDTGWTGAWPRPIRDTHAEWRELQEEEPQ